MSTPALNNLGLWRTIRDEAAALSAAEPAMSGFLTEAILQHNDMADALAFLVASKLAGDGLEIEALQAVTHEAIAADATIVDAAITDIEAVRERDPACKTYATPFLFFKGYQALQCYRIAHWLWGQKRESLAALLQYRISERFAVDIHPAARIGKGILLDHGTGFVVGETAVIDDHVSILQEVTLGGTGKEFGDRHPKIRRGVLISAGAKILGNIVIGEGVKVGAGSVVLHDVPPHVTVVGVPARVVGKCESQDPASLMDQRIDESD